MSEELVQGNGQSQLPSLVGADHASSEAFDSMVRQSFLARVNLMAGVSGLVAEGKMNVGKYALIRSKEDFVDLGGEFVCLPLSYRFCAMRFQKGDGSEDDKFQVFYNPESDGFKQIRVDSETPNSGCSYGPQFLLWLPRQKEFVSYLFGSKSSRGEARKMNQLLLPTARPVTMKTKLVQYGGKKWHVPVVLPYSGEIEYPDADKAVEEAEKFNKPTDNDGSGGNDDATGSGTEATAGAGERAR